MFLYYCLAKVLASMPVFLKIFEKFTIMCKNLFINTAKKLRISQVVVESMPNTCTNKQKFLTVLENSWYISLSIGMKRPHLCFQGISSKKNVSYIAAIVFTLQLECQKQLIFS